MSFIPKPQEIYKHFKGNLYQIITLAEHSETGESLVIYQALYGDFRIYARPLEMFTSRVDKEKYPEVTQEFRFELQGPDCDRQQVGPSAACKKEPACGTAARKEEPVVSASGSKEPAVSANGSEEPALDPLVMEFLDADTYEQKLNILSALRHRITDDMITTMAIACDIEVNEGDTNERYEALRNCLLTLDKYECSRLR